MREATSVLICYDRQHTPLQWRWMVVEDDNDDDCDDDQYNDDVDDLFDAADNDDKQYDQYNDDVNCDDRWYYQRCSIQLCVHQR